MPKIKFLASVNVEAALLAPEKLLLLPPGRERKSKLIFFYSYIVGPATGGSDASHCSFMPRLVPKNFSTVPVTSNLSTHA